MLAALFLSAWAIAAAPEPGDAATQLVRDACIATGMQKDAFERLGRERRWRRARLSSPSTEPGSWHVGFQAREGLVTLSTIPQFPGQPAVDGAACMVMVESVGDDWLPAAEDLAAEIGLGGYQALSATPGPEEMHVWSDGPGGQTMTVAYARQRRVLSITYVKRVPGPTP